MSEARIILDLCGGTGAWSRPYVEAGYDVRLVTLPEMDVRDYEPPAFVHGILAAPPCTEFSIAKGAHPRDFVGAMEVVSACLRIVWRCRIAGGLTFWVLENPVGFLRQFLGVPRHTIRYWWYGDEFVKPTDLWGYFRPPRRRCAKRPESLKPLLGWPNWDGKAADRRAVTPPGFAEAFFKANP